MVLSGQGPVWTGTCLVWNLVLNMVVSAEDKPINEIWKNNNLHWTVPMIEHKKNEPVHGIKAKKTALNCLYKQQ